jgi:hypothetical protein
MIPNAHPPDKRRRRLASLPPARRKATRLLADLLRHRPFLDVAVQLELGIYIIFEARGIGRLGAERALLDLLWVGAAEAAPGAGPGLCVRASGGTRS